MAAITWASLHLKTPTPSLHFPNLPKPHSILTRPAPRPRIRASLIEPDGGTLVELMVKESEKLSKVKAAEQLPKIRLSAVDLQWVHVLSEGWASPLRGFMRESEFLQTLHFSSLRLHDGSRVNMSVPIVLALDDLQKSRVGSSTAVALVDDGGDLVAILSE
ncbi:hypothetical protein SASPL_145801 [Salvia splendens]|uniref:ATP-sulfurylase PUA-like domain-containing protein n=1 Tax=Salvia splendens TaxID=180675 RepID=A0A8X8Z8F3_SALSN|nr:hypothetical protein SASPL_145801 [Salvia splendens]